jgi:hypothetical protein
MRLHGIKLNFSKKFEKALFFLSKIFFFEKIL